MTMIRLESGLKFRESFVVREVQARGGEGLDHGRTSLPPNSHQPDL